MRGWTVKVFINPLAWAVLTDSAPPEKVCEIPEGPGAYQKALLIAAAPQLLEACQTVREFFDNLEANTDSADPLSEVRRRIHAPLRAKLEPAIAKAEGVYESGASTANTRTTHPSLADSPTSTSKDSEVPS
jgi:hypothetical protein